MFDGPPIDCDGKVDPSAFAVPEAVPTELEELARSLRSSGVSVAGSGEDITSSWAGLSECYTAPEAETLYSALSPVSSSGIVIEMATDRVAGAIEDFAETVRSLKIRWNGLTTRAEAFLAEIAGDDDWDKADGFFSDQSENVDKNTALIEEAARLTAEYNEAERTCANKINIGIDGRTEFVEGSEVGANGPAPGEFVYGLDADLSGVPMEWGAPAEVDSSWLVDVGDAVWDFGVGAVEGTGAMVGAHSSEGWFEMSWGDAMWEYHEDNIQSAASLVGMYDAESDSYGWAGGDVAVSAWKDLAHSVVPWEEWGDRPGYVIGTAVLNIGVMAAGAALSATGVGAAVGVPLMAWRGMAILDGMGGRGGGSGSGAGSGPDIDTGLPANIPGFGGSGSPVFNLDLSRFTGGNTTSTQLADMNSALSRLLGTTHDPPSAGGAPDGPRAQPASDASDEQPTRKPRPNRTEGAPSDEAGEGAQTDPTVQQLNDTEGLLDELNRLTGVRDDPAHTAGVSPDAKRDPGADWEGGWFAEDMPTVDELTPEQRANTGYGPDEPDRTLARVGGDGDGDTLTASRDIPGSASDARADLTGIGGDQFGNDGPRPHDQIPPVMNSDGHGGDPLDGNGDSRGGTSVLDRDGGDSTSGSGGDGSNGSGQSVSGPGGGAGGTDRGDGSDGLPSNVDELREHRWGRSEEAKKRFYEHFAKLVNNTESGVFKEFYKKNGHRLSRFLTVGPDELTLPKLTRFNESSPWIVRETLPTPDEPRYKGEDSDHLFKRDLENSPVNELDRLAERRASAIGVDKSATQSLQALETKYKDHLASGGGVPDDLAAARDKYSTAHAQMTKAAENYGEGVAEAAVREQFDGSPVLDKDGNPKLDTDGNVVHSPKVVAQIPMPDTVPKNGNHQFDQIWTTEDGGIVVVEAKSSQSTPLGDRIVEGDDGNPKRVSQGTREYLEDVLEKMRERGRSDSKNSFNETHLANLIEDALDEDNLHYVEVKGNPVTHTLEDGTATHRSGGYSFREFDISEEE